MDEQTNAYCDSLRPCRSQKRFPVLILSVLQSKVQKNVCNSRLVLIDCRSTCICISRVQSSFITNLKHVDRGFVIFTESSLHEKCLIIKHESVICWPSSSLVIISILTPDDANTWHHYHHNQHSLSRTSDTCWSSLSDFNAHPVCQCIWYCQARVQVPIPCCPNRPQIMTPRSDQV